MDKFNKTIYEKVNDIYERTVSIRRDLHMHPELSEHESRTEKVISDRLTRLCINHEDHIAGHGIIGTIYGKDQNKAIAIRADIDALPITEMSNVPYKSTNLGVMHACGHDIHTSILLGTAQLLNEMKSVLPYCVKLLFQPSEETTGGAHQMIKCGCLKSPDVQAVIGLHVETSIPVGSVMFTPGSMNAASTEFFVKVNGRSCHGAHPDKGIDALLPACAMVASIQSIITRNIDPAEPALITVGKFNSGCKNNIISGSATFSGIIRVLNLNTREYIKNHIKMLCDNIAASYGATCNLEFRDSYPPLENNQELLETVENVAKYLIGPENVYISGKPSLGSDDFSYFCHECKSLYFNIGTQKPDDNNVAPIHSEYFDPDEECIKTGILMEVGSILKLMEVKI